MTRLGYRHAAAAVVGGMLTLAQAAEVTEPPCSPPPSLHTVAALRSIDAADHRWDDLAAFGQAVGDARVVVLGEQTHGDGNVFALKNRLVQYLHEQLGFEVLALESGLFDGWRVNQAVAQGQSMRQAAKGNLFFMYSGTREVAPMFDYLQASLKTPHPMRLATFDPQHSGGLSIQHLVPDLAKLLKARGSDVTASSAWPVFARTAEALFKLNRKAPPSDQQTAFFEVLARAKAAITSPTAKPDVETSFWLRVLASVDNQARNYWRLHPGLAEGLDRRDQAMGDNLVWLLTQQHPKARVVVWAHDWHGGRHTPVAESPGAMQEVLAQLPQLKSYHVYFTGYAGNTIEFGSGNAWKITPHPAGTLEAALHGLGVKQGFVDLKTGRVAGLELGHVPSTDYNGGVFPKFPISQIADGVFFFDEIVPTVRE